MKARAFNARMEELATPLSPLVTDDNEKITGFPRDIPTIRKMERRCFLFFSIFYFYNLNIL